MSNAKEIQTPVLSEIMDRMDSIPDRAELLELLKQVAIEAKKQDITQVMVAREIGHQRAYVNSIINGKGYSIDKILMVYSAYKKLLSDGNSDK